MTKNEEQTRSVPMNELSLETQLQADLARARGTAVKYLMVADRSKRENVHRLIGQIMILEDECQDLEGDE